MPRAFCHYCYSPTSPNVMPATTAALDPLTATEADYSPLTMHPGEEQTIRKDLATAQGYTAVNMARIEVQNRYLDHAKMLMRELDATRKTLIAREKELDQCYKESGLLDEMYTYVKLMYGVNEDEMKQALRRKGIKI